MRFRSLIYAFPPLATLVVCLIIHDPWLRPWNTLLIPAVLLLASLALVALSIRRRWYVVGGLILVLLLVVLLALPLHSSRRVLQITNHVSYTVGVVLQDVNATRSVRRALRPGSTWDFVYYLGDVPEESGNLQVVLTASGPDPSATVEKKLNLPLNDPFSIRIRIELINGRLSVIEEAESVRL